MARVPTLDLVLLRTFVSVANVGSMSAASRQLHLTQGAVSQQIKRLEAFCGYPLLDRESHGVALTPAGMALLPKASRLLALNDSLCDELLAPASKVTLRVGVPYDLAGAPFAPVLAAYAERYPDRDVVVSTGSSLDLLGAFDDGHLDLTISQGPRQARRGEILGVEPLVWVGARSELAATRPLPLCFVTPTCTFRRLVLSRLGQEDIAWRERIENASVETTLATVRSGLALTPWLRSLVPADLHILGAECGLPRLPDIDIQLHVQPAAAAAASALAESIRLHHRAGALAATPV